MGSRKVGGGRFYSEEDLSDRRRDDEYAKNAYKTRASNCLFSSAGPESGKTESFDGFDKEKRQGQIDSLAGRRPSRGGSRVLVAGSQSEQSRLDWNSRFAAGGRAAVAAATAALVAVPTASRR